MNIITTFCYEFLIQSMFDHVGGNEYGQCGEEPERKDDTGKPVRRDIVIPQRCVPKLTVRQVQKKEFLLFCGCKFVLILDDIGLFFTSQAKVSKP